MKKIIYSLGVVLVVAIVALLYTYATTFEVRNVEEISVIDKDYKFDLTDQRTEDFVKKLQALKQYDQLTSVESVISETIVLDMKYSQDKMFKIHLDHNFESLYITDLKNNITYEVDDMVTWLYMLPVFDGVYNYQTPIRHDVIVDEKKLENGAVDYYFKKADDIWHSKIVESDALPVVVTVSEPNVLFTVKSDASPQTVVLKVYSENELIYNKPLNEGIYQPVYNGEYVYEITSTWQEPLYYGHEKTEFIVQADYPPEFTASSLTMNQGEFIILKASRVDEDDGLYIAQGYMDGLAFEKNGDIYECLIPSTYYTTPGQYTLAYGVKDQSFELNFEVKERTFNYQYLTVDQNTTASTQNAEAYAQYNKYYKPALLKNVYQSESSHMTEQAFILPVTGRLTTEFGVQRYVNEKLTSYHHSGLDIANDRGTEIVSTYDGEVVLSMLLKVTGNTIVISHGNGLFSSYLHMNSLNVQEGDVVKTGDLIGTIGTTGFSTGPHLHFTISYYKMNLEPGYFIYGEPVTYENYNALFGE